MSIGYNPFITTSNLVLYLDAGNTKSYSGSGTTWNDLCNNIVFSSTSYTYPTYNNGYFTFVNNGSTVNNIKCSSISVSTSSDQYYTRIAWFYQTSQSAAWGPLIQNSIGNNSDMGLTTNGNRLHFRQYINSNNGAQGDTGYSSSGTFDNNVWVMGAITVDRPNRIVKFYINGSYDSQSSLNIIGSSNSDIIVIGGADVDGYSGDRMFKGRIASVMHYNKILSDAEISQNFNALRGRFGI